MTIFLIFIVVIERAAFGKFLDPGRNMFLNLETAPSIHPAETQYRATEHLSDCECFEGARLLLRLFPVEV